ncbi:hypothetical protein CHLRE_09g392803v5 [Chlamydomonas reinhardtii]|uniref:Uncharacterized protein n=1 Tax=Chlamydomonas reinhardtii TaxID=3055 RepID=A0A2K3DEB8_CHLRE|nr:uncharacterized protein CHLRE_09g392803v5 [Chlamydomonas reinhardtii]PNW78869.1 hypothetical protein CHLRE_09g392803v5 [Chlamydomonas reinhardtii]
MLLVAIGEGDLLVSNRGSLTVCWPSVPQASVPSPRVYWRCCERHALVGRRHGCCTHLAQRVGRNLFTASTSRRVSCSSIVVSGMVK